VSRLGNQFLGLQEYYFPTPIDSLTLQAVVRAVESRSADELDEEIDRDLEHCREFFGLFLANGTLPAQNL